MTTKVKICGLRTETALEVALDGGADYVGLVFFPPSPRYVSLAQAAAMAAKARNRAKVVALLVDPDEALIADVLAAATPDLLQLHGQETPERVAEIRTRWGVPDEGGRGGNGRGRARGDALFPGDRPYSV